MATARNFAIVHRLYDGLALAYGMESAAILSQVYYMQKRGRNGLPLPVRVTFAQLAKAMPYLSRHTIERHVRALMHDRALIRREVGPQRYEYSVNYALIVQATGVRIGSTRAHFQTFNPFIAEALGLRAAVVLGHILYWEAHGLHRIMAGEKAIYRAFESDRQENTWASMLPYMSKSTVQRCLGKLASLGLVVIGRPIWSTRRTLWYAVKRDVLSEMCHYLGAGDIDVSAYKIERAEGGGKPDPALAARFAARMEAASATGFRRPDVWGDVEALEPKARKLVKPILEAVDKVHAVRHEDVARLLLVLCRYRLDDVLRCLRVILARPARRIWRQFHAMVACLKPSRIPALR